MLHRCAFWMLLVLQLASSAVAFGELGSNNSPDAENVLDMGSPMLPTIIFCVSLFLVMVSALVVALLVHRARRAKPTKPRQESSRD